MEEGGLAQEVDFRPSLRVVSSHGVADTPDNLLSNCMPLSDPKGYRRKEHSTEVSNAVTK